MFTFLPREYKARVLHEYRMRVVFVGLALLAASLLLGAVLSVPTFLVVSAQRDALIVEKERVERSASSVQDDSVSREIEVIDGRLSVLARQSEREAIVSVLDHLLSKPRQGVLVMGIELRREKTGGTIVLQGKADTREHLVMFSKSLQGDSSFSKVDLPVSSLAKSVDVPFSIRIASEF